MLKRRQKDCKRQRWWMTQGNTVIHVVVCCPLDSFHCRSAWEWSVITTWQSTVSCPGISSASNISPRLFTLASGRILVKGNKWPHSLLIYDNNANILHLWNFLSWTSMTTLFWALLFSKLLLLPWPVKLHLKYLTDFQTEIPNIFHILPWSSTVWPVIAITLALISLLHILFCVAVVLHV